jgi:hypothetical protein
MASQQIQDGRKGKRQSKISSQLLSGENSFSETTRQQEKLSKGGKLLLQFAGLQRVFRSGPGPV